MKSSIDSMTAMDLAGPEKSFKDRRRGPKRRPPKRCPPKTPLQSSEAQTLLGRQEPKSGQNRKILPGKRLSRSPLCSEVPIAPSNHSSETMDPSTLIFKSPPLHQQVRLVAAPSSEPPIPGLRTYGALPPSSSPQQPRSQAGSSLDAGVLDELFGPLSAGQRSRRESSSALASGRRSRRESSPAVAMATSAMPAAAAGQGGDGALQWRGGAGRGAERSCSAVSAASRSPPSPYKYSSPISRSRASSTYYERTYHAAASGRASRRGSAASSPFAAGLLGPPPSPPGAPPAPEAAARRRLRSAAAPPQSPPAPPPPVATGKYGDDWQNSPPSNGKQVTPPRTIGVVRLPFSLQKEKTCHTEEVSFVSYDFDGESQGSFTYAEDNNDAYWMKKGAWKNYSKTESLAQARMRHKCFKNRKKPVKRPEHLAARPLHHSSASSPSKNNQIIVSSSNDDYEKDNR